jgi:hypothetical protein
LLHPAPKNVHFFSGCQEEKKKKKKPSRKMNGGRRRFYFAIPNVMGRSMKREQQRNRNLKKNGILKKKKIKFNFF